MTEIKGQVLDNFDIKVTNSVWYVAFNNKSKSYNVFDTKTLDELETIISAIEDDLSCDGVVFRSAKKGFIVGADIKEFNGASRQEIEALVKKGQLLFNRIEDLEIPSLAMINGVAMGGGLELTLACTGRIAYTNAQLALPETKLGILPGWGGTTRLPRLIGLANAISLICSGKTIGTREAKKIGLIDGVAADDKLIGRLINAAKREVAKRRKKKIGSVKSNAFKSVVTFKMATKNIVAQTKGNYPAPMVALEVMKNSRSLCRDEALERERAAFVDLSQTEVTANLISIFFGERGLKAKANEWTLGVPEIKKVAVLGAGAMGAGIAFAIANKAGIKVLLYDPYEEQLYKANKANRVYLKTKVDKGYISVDECNEILDLVTTTPDINKAVANADIVIEAVPENLKLKRTVFNQAIEIAPETILATNTSTFKVDDMQDGLDAGRFGGLHFFNPVSKMPLVEVVRGNKTSDETVSKLCTLALAMKKIPIVCNDCAGFVVNRILMPYLVEFDHMVSSGIDFEYIDKVMKKFGWPMGPAELCDLVGMDVIYHGASNIAKEYEYINLPDGSMCKNLYEEGTLGQKTQKGFYNWKGTKKKSRAIDTGSEQPPELEIEQRLIAVMKQEAQRILDESIVEDPYEINMAMIFGIGYPPYKKGII
jgi:3-hydroxyacyl-CoA dehydrogenase/enoyl-CoA hydratase/3-hydroxybutyryl-CoA epimerase/enoyl-CoA isomerase